MSIRFLALNVALITLWSLPASCLAGAERPNILFIFADDLGFGDLASHGHPLVETPHLDRLAAEGTDFRHFLVASGVCSPSRAAVMTGQYPSRHRVHGHFAQPYQNAARGMPNFLDPDAPLISRVLKEAGYATGHFGKWHLSGSPHEKAPSPRRYGFDRSAVWTGPSPDVFTDVPIRYQRRDRRLDAAAAQSVQLSPAATWHAQRFIRQHAGEPWFVNLWLHETHQIVAATDAEKERYAEIPEPQRTYLANVSRADDCVGRMLESLDELGLAENTLVLFSSDNGPENHNPNPKAKMYTSVGETGGLRGRKRSLYLGGVNVPFLVRWPGRVPAGRRDDETVIGAVDLFPTFLAATGTAAPAGYASDGMNVLPAFEGKPFERSQPLFWQWNANRPASSADWPAAAMRDGDYALLVAIDIENRPDRIELYNVATDRGQTTNLADEQPERTQRMLASLRTWEDTLPAAPRATVNDARKAAKKN